MTALRRSGDPECEFCRIIFGESVARVLGETEDALAFLPLAPATFGHALVIPKRHITDIWSLDMELLKPLGQMTLRIAWAIRRTIEPDGLNIINSNGVAASQTVPHLHVHVLPRFRGDAIGEIWPPKEVRSKDLQEDILNEIRKAFDGITADFI